MHLLVSLKFVDWVINFSEETLENLICPLPPDILVKDDDYKEDEVASLQCARDNGDKISILTLVDGISTSEIMAKIKFIGS